MLVSERPASILYSPGCSAVCSRLNHTLYKYFTVTLRYLTLSLQTCSSYNFPISVMAISPSQVPRSKALEVSLPPHGLSHSRATLSTNLFDLNFDLQHRSGIHPLLAPALHLCPSIPSSIVSHLIDRSCFLAVSPFPSLLFSTQQPE